jgi:hypothetical protein
MANMIGKVLLASSNVYKFHDDKGKISSSYKIIKCTQAETFEAHMTHLREENKLVLISVVENFIADAVTNQAEPDAEIVFCLKSFLKLIEEAALRLPGSKFGVAMPLQRPKHPWYQTRVEDITDNLMAGIKDIVTRNETVKVADIWCSPASLQDFEKDGVHLSVASGRIIVDAIISGAEAFFNAPLVDISDEVNEELPGGHDADLIKSLEARLKRLEMESKKQVEINFANNLIIARTREEIDSTSNRSKEDRVVMTGLKSKTPIPADNRARIEWLKNLAIDIFKKLIPGFPGKIFYLNQGKNADKLLPMIELRMDKVENAFAIWKAFALKRKDKSLPAELDSLFVTNCVNLATRVHIDVLKAIARKITNDKDVAYVSGFILRPLMHIKKAGSGANTRPLKSFTYIDAITRFHNTLKKADLTTAYERAGIAFCGQLSQNFVVLNDEDQATLGPRLGTSMGGGGKSGTPTSGGSTSRGVKRLGKNLESERSKK